MKSHKSESILNTTQIQCSKSMALQRFFSSKTFFFFFKHEIPHKNPTQEPDTHGTTLARRGDVPGALCIQLLPPQSPLRCLRPHWMPWNKTWKSLNETCAFQTWTIMALNKKCVLHSDPEHTHTHNTEVAETIFSLNAIYSMFCILPIDGIEHELGILITS